MKRFMPLKYALLVVTMVFVTESSYSQSFDFTSIKKQFDNYRENVLQEKIYVQDKLKKRGSEFYSWLKSGATVYICGAKRMSEDVERTILDIIRQSGETEDAEAFFNQLKESGRYLKDVY